MSRRFVLVVVPWSYACVLVLAVLLAAAIGLVDALAVLD